MTTVYLKRSTSSGKKYMVLVQTPKKSKTVHFGAAGMSDYTKHKDDQRKARYVQRHKSRENWSKSGINTAGFWSRWLLWNKPTIQASIKNIEKRFNVTIKRSWPRRSASPRRKSPFRFSPARRVPLRRGSPLGPARRVPLRRGSPLGPARRVPLRRGSPLGPAQRVLVPQRSPLGPARRVPFRFHSQQDKWVMYALDGCGACAAAKEYFRDKGIQVTIYDQDDYINIDPQLRRQVEAKNHDTWPRIFKNGRFIGGYSDLN